MILMNAEISEPLTWRKPSNEILLGHLPVAKFCPHQEQATKPSPSLREAGKNHFFTDKKVAKALWGFLLFYIYLFDCIRS